MPTFSPEEKKLVSSFISSGLAANDIDGITEYFLQLMFGGDEDRSQIALQMIGFCEASVAEYQTELSGLDTKKENEESALNAAIDLADGVKIKFQEKVLPS